MRHSIKLLLCLSAALPLQAHAAVSLIAKGTLSTPGNHDLSGLDYNLESGLQADFFGGIGSGLAYAGGNTFLGLPDRGPNATPYAGGAPIDNTVSWIPRFQTLSLTLKASAAGSALPFELQTELKGTTLLWSSNPLVYGSGSAYPGGVAGNWINDTPGKYYFSGRSDNFGAGNSMNPNFARLDPEGIRVSADGKSVYVSDEYGPYIRQFDRETGELIKSIELPEHLAIKNLFPTVAAERDFANNNVGRYTNSGMEGLAISPDGKFLVGAIQGALLQDRKEAPNLLRLVKVNLETGEVQEFGYVANAGTMIGISEIIAINDHQFLVDERDGSGMGGSPAGAIMKKFYMIDLNDATPIPEGVTGAAAQALAVTKNPTPFIDLVKALTDLGIPADQIPSKIEGMAFGQDVMVDGELTHTIYISDDNDFVPATSGPNHFYVFGFTDKDLPGYVPQQIASVPEPATWAMLVGGFAFIGGSLRRRASKVRFA